MRRFCGCEEGVVGVVLTGNISDNKNNHSPHCTPTSVHVHTHASFIAHKYSHPSLLLIVLTLIYTRTLCCEAVEGGEWMASAGHQLVGCGVFAQTRAKTKLALPGRVGRVTRDTHINLVPLGVIHHGCSQTQ